jgi:predicted metal-dependent hydrolase
MKARNRLLRMSEHTLQYGSTGNIYTLDYTDRQTLAIHVHPNLHVTVEAPLDSDLAEIEKRLHKKAAWILRQQRDFKRYSFDIPPRHYVSGETYRYLGQQYRLKVLQSEDGREAVVMDREQITVTARDKEDRSRVKKLLTGWYRQHAYEIFGERVTAWFPRFKRYGIEQPKVHVRQMRSQWGSCTANGKMTLNLKLIMVPRPLIDYVVVHELCHLVEHNHAPAFYKLLGKVMPDWESRRETLNGFEY